MPLKNLPLPGWYDERLVGNPLFSANLDMIQQEAYRMRKLHDISSVKNDKVRIFRFHVDPQNCFTQPLTSVDPYTGIVTRYLPPFVSKELVPKWWTAGNNRLVWMDKDFDPRTIPSITGGHLSVAGAWHDMRRVALWDMANAHRITQHGISVDFHQWTSRFDMHYYVASADNPYGLTAGSHPYMFMDGPDKPFPIITPENLWHPEHNPKGWWKPIIQDKKYLDETWYYTNKLGFVILWTKHGHRFSIGGLTDPIIYASIAHHYFMRGIVLAEPLWFTKGEGWRFEFFGAYQAEYDGPQDENTKESFDILNLFVGFHNNGFEVEPFDWVIFNGEASSHCVIKTVEQEVDRLKRAGREGLIKRMICLTDGMSPIIGFEEETEKRFDALAKKGVRLETTKTLDLSTLTK